MSAIDLWRIVGPDVTLALTVGGVITLLAVLAIALSRSGPPSW